jgi:MHS family proline/betaine transporter-like MFS transporter
MGSPPCVSTLSAILPAVGDGEEIAGGAGTDVAAAGTRRAVVVAALGTIIEWYDFSLYVFLAPIYARVFFPGAEGLDGLVATLAIFAIAYLARPLGAIVFGHFGDRIGRRGALLISASIMSVALLLNSLLPSEATIGVAAPIGLFVLRLAMGFAVGGEYSGILVYLLEIAKVRSRGLVVSFAPAASGIGTLIAVGSTAIVSSLLSQQQVDDWGWRIPVLLGAALAVTILILRRSLAETPAFHRMRESGRVSEHPVRDAVVRARWAVFVAFALSAVGSVAFYLGITYVPTFLESFGKAPHDDALIWSTVATAIYVLLTPLAGWWADASGRRASLAITALALVVASVPAFALLAGSAALVQLAAAVALATGAAAWCSIEASVVPEQFGTADRFSGLAVGYNIATAVFGGLAPLAATLLVRATGWDPAPGLMLAVVALAVLPVVLGLSETARRPLREE